MQTHSLRLVTIIGEALAREPLQKLLTASGAHGYTLFTVEGDGAQGRRAGDIREFANIQVEVLVPPAVAESLLAVLEREFSRGTPWSPTRRTSA